MPKIKSEKSKKNEMGLAIYKYFTAFLFPILSGGEIRFNTPLCFGAIIGMCMPESCMKIITTTEKPYQRGL